MGQAEDFDETLERLTPGLRRYARALLSGAVNDVADELVQTALQTTADESKLDSPRRDSPNAVLDLRVDLYASLTHAAQRRLRSAAPHRPSLRQPAIMHRLADLPFEERETLLLVVLEGFTYDEVARITRTDRPVALMRLMRARSALTALDRHPSPGADAGRRPGPHLRVVK
ncbi:MAG TPA: sigma factor-like helix-turn-helix DNA-binding protein [Methylosinus sp.]|jgi:RNA polymerase sigma-70 factor (ECF subfamily)|uniref:sigma factor-like helix-turn-helix DNA-binding protein n=1 Tax=Hyphomicrobiales TaxID=356 RepID=UPI002F955AA5